MTKADEFWEKYADLQQDQGAGPCTWSMRYDQFLAALAEYGEAVRAENSELRKDAIKWLEDNHTLHTSVEILYVVDGYEVTVMHENGVTPLSKTYHGETLLTAIDKARSANDKG